MPLTQNKITVHLARDLATALSAAYPAQSADAAALQEAIVPPPKAEMGHFCLPCFSLAGPLKTPPAKIAQALGGQLKTGELIAQVQAQGPYLNLSVTPASLQKWVVEDILAGDFFRSSPTPEKLLIEYSQPNTHKVLHVGHMRNLCLGNALVRILRYTGAEVISATYPGDVGAHVAKCLWYLQKHSPRPSQGEHPGEWLGKVYTLASEAFAKAPPQEKAKSAEILRQIADQKGEFFELWRETRKWSVELMEEAYRRAEVTFDRWYWESEVDRDSLAYAARLFEEGKLIKDQGAIGMDLSEERMGFCMLIKSDGTGLYATKDLLLAKRKFEEHAPDRSIYVVDNRQKMHFKQVFKTLEKLGDANADKCLHLAYEMVELPEGPMSSRRGNTVPLMELVEDMEQKITDDYLKKYADTWPAKDLKTCAAHIAGGAIKYGMLRVDNNRKIVFDKNEWLKLDGETGPYLQYVHARIQSLLAKHPPVQKATAPAQWHEKEISLMVKLSQFNNIVSQCARQLKTMPLCAYLYETGKLFNAFYTECPIAKAPAQDIRHFRLQLARATGLVMARGLDLLGISAPDKM